MTSEYEVVLTAEAAALPGQRDELKQAIDELIPKSLAEQGIDSFGCTKTVISRALHMLYERFHNQGAIDPHFASEHFAVITASCRPFGGSGKPKITYFRVLSD
jgi:quinol monooxygenase YgiN